VKPHQTYPVIPLKTSLRKAAVLLLSFALGSVWPAKADQRPTPDVREVARKVDRNYNDLQTLQADFEESYRGAGVARHESGVLWLKRPGMMRWEYHSPREKLFITNGKSAFFHVIGEHQARKAKLDKIDDLRSPLRYLLGKTKLDKEFDNLRLLPSSANASFVLEGVPKTMQERVERVRLEIGPRYEIQSIMIEEIDGAVTEFRFNNQVENAAVSDHKFRFKPPPGVHVIEGTEVMP
jgi:outer membrane lipoprotein carrier protein